MYRYWVEKEFLKIQLNKCSKDTWKILFIFKMTPIPHPRERESNWNLTCQPHRVTSGRERERETETETETGRQTDRDRDRELPLADCRFLTSEVQCALLQHEYFVGDFAAWLWLRELRWELVGLGQSLGLLRCSSHCSSICSTQTVLLQVP